MHIGKILMLLLKIRLEIKLKLKKLWSKMLKLLVLVLKLKLRRLNPRFLIVNMMVVLVIKGPQMLQLKILQKLKLLPKEL